MQFVKSNYSAVMFINLYIQTNWKQLIVFEIARTCLISYSILSILFLHISALLATVIQLFSFIYNCKLLYSPEIEIKITRGLLGRTGDVNITRALRKFYFLFRVATHPGQANPRVCISLSWFSMRKSVVKSLSTRQHALFIRFDRGHLSPARVT